MKEDIHMDVKVIKRVLRVVSLLLAVAAMIFVLVSIFSDGEGRGMLNGGLICVVLSNLFGLIVPGVVKDSGSDKKD